MVATLLLFLTDSLSSMSTFMTYYSVYVLYCDGGFSDLSPAFISQRAPHIVIFDQNLFFNIPDLSPSSPLPSPLRQARLRGDERLPQHRLQGHLHGVPVVGGGHRHGRGGGAGGGRAPQVGQGERRREEQGRTDEGRGSTERGK